MRFKVPAGASFAHVAADLASQASSRSPERGFYTRAGRDWLRPIKAGEYEIPAGHHAARAVDENGERPGAAAFLHHRRWLAGAGSARGHAPQSRDSRHVAAQAHLPCRPPISWRKSALPALKPRGSSCRRPIVSSAAPPTSNCCARRMRRWPRNWMRHGRAAIPTCRCTIPMNC